MHAHTHTRTHGNTQNLIGWTNAAVSCALHCDCESTAGAMSLAFNEESKKKKNPHTKYNGQEECSPENYNKRLLNRALICHNEE